VSSRACAAHNEDVLTIGHRPFDDGFLAFAHDAGRDVIGERENRRRLAPDREHGRRNHGRDQPLEAAAIERQLAFEDGMVASDGGLMRGGDGGERRLGSVWGKRAEAAR
jgi:hypothetical protein